MKIMTAYDYLHRNGVIAEKARRERRSLNEIEKNILAVGLRFAREKGLDRWQMNAMVMEGERDWEQVLAPIKVVAVFAYYDEGYDEIPPTPQYVVRESNFPALSVGSHVGIDQILEATNKVPKTPSYEKWVKGGRQVIRS